MPDLICFIPPYLDTQTLNLKINEERPLYIEKIKTKLKETFTEGAFVGYKKLGRIS